MVESTDPKGDQNPENGGLQQQVSNVTENDEALKAELAKLQTELEEGK